MTQTSYSVADRRPIATRRSRWAQAIASLLVRAHITPNAISIAGMIAGILAGIALAATARTDGAAQRALWIAAAALVQIRLMANMFDGMVAVETAQASPVGELFNEIPDRISDAAALIGLGYALASNATLGYIATSLAIFTAYVRAQGKAAGAKHEFCGPMAKPHRMFVVTLTCIVMALLPRRMTAALIGHFGLPSIALALIIAGCAITAVRRLARIAATLRGQTS